MTYLIAGLDPAQFAPLWEMNGDELACAGGRRVVADADDGFACRVTLENARRGDGLLLLHHVHHDVAGPYRAAFAIFVGPGTVRAEYRNECPPSFHGRTISMRGFDAGGTMVATSLAPPGTTDTVIRALLVDPQIAYIHAHNAGAGCFAARIERDG